MNNAVRVTVVDHPLAAEQLALLRDSATPPALFRVALDALAGFDEAPGGASGLPPVVEIHNEATGILPSSAWKMKRYKQKWLPGETPSIGIGQGYNSFTIVQLAHAVATLANNAVVIKPHVVRAVEDPVDRKRTPVGDPDTHRIPVKQEYIDMVKAAMVDVNKFGTSRMAFVGAEYTSGGKTGTAQVIGIKQGEKYDAKRIAERFRDHSLFIAFAPAEDPKIALAAIVENGGFGAQAAAPIARQVLDYYLLGKKPKAPAPADEDAVEEDAE